MQGSNSQHLKLTGVSIRYGTQDVIRHVSLDIPRNRITALIGPSGCGKSSLISAINRMTDTIPNCQVTGHIDFDSVNVLGDGTNLIGLRRKIGMIFQKPNPFPLSIQKNIELPLREHGIGNRKQRMEKVEAVLRATGMWDEVSDRLNSPAFELSGGQQQRLCIARALALEPEIILFDEPCSALDPIASGIVEDLIVNLKSKATIVLVSHDIAQARRIADQVAVFWYESGAGKLVEVCTDLDKFENSTHPITRCFIDGTRC